MTPDQYEEFIDKYGDIDSKKIIRGSKQRYHEICLWCFEEVGVFLADALINAVRILDVKTIVIGGGMSKILYRLHISIHVQKNEENITTILYY